MLNPKEGLVGMNRMIIIGFIASAHLISQISSPGFNGDVLDGSEVNSLIIGYELVSVGAIDILMRHCLIVSCLNPNFAQSARVSQDSGRK